MNGTSASRPDALSYASTMQITPYDLPASVLHMAERNFVEVGWAVLAQTGTTKTIVGWVLVLLCLALALLVVGRPNAREPRRKRW